MDIVVERPQGTKAARQPGTKPAASRAYSVKQVLNKKRIVYDFEGRFAESFGKPERNAIWCIWGQSGNGKTRFLLQLCKYLCAFGTVAYNSLEEGESESFAKALRETDMHEVDGKFKLIDMEPAEQFVHRLTKKKAAQFAVIDSVQYAGFDYNFYKAMKQKLRKKSLLFISHAQGSNPLGRCADAIRYDSGIKVHVIGYVAKVRCRYGGNKPYVIWEEGAKKYWGKKYNNVIAGKYWPGEKK
jgi:hypothetical protein